MDRSAFFCAALALGIVLLPSVLAANNPGHDSLYVLKFGDSNVVGSVNITDALNASNVYASALLYGDQLDIRANGSILAVTNRPAIQADSEDLYLDAKGNIHLATKGGTTGMIQLGPTTGSAVTFNVSGTIYERGVRVCLADGTNCPGGNNTGNISTVTAGTGLVNSGTANDPVLDVGVGAGLLANPNDIAVNTSYVQRRVNETCAAGSSIRAINEDGTVACETDSEGSGGDGTGGWVNTSTTTQTGLLMNVNNNAVLFNGTTGATPASGAGTRMMWIPAKSAFRAGYVEGTQWDDTNIGQYSAAVGRNNTAKGESTFAAGLNNSANSAYSVAMGYGNIASHQSAIALGQSNTVVGAYGVAMGLESRVDGQYGVAIGYANLAGIPALNYASAAVGGYANAATGYYSSVFGGSTNTASGLLSSVLNGQVNTASGNFSTVIGGQYMTASGTNSILLGSGISAGNRLTNSIPYSLMVGFNSTTPTLFVNSTALGVNTITPTQTLDVNGSANFSGANAQVWVNGSLVCTAANGLCAGLTSESDPAWSGNSSTVARTGTCAAGTVVQNTTTGGVQCIVVGTGNGNLSGSGEANKLAYWSSATAITSLAGANNGAIYYSGAGAVQSGTLPVLSGGTGVTTKTGTGSVVLNTAPSFSGNVNVTDGAVLFKGLTGDTPMSGNGVRMMWVPSKYALRAGLVNADRWDAANIGTSSVGIGADVMANGSGSMAFGSFTTASADYALAAGYSTTASGYNSVALGASTAASGIGATALGMYSAASGIASTALGSGTVASGRTATALGRESVASGNLSFAAGIGAQASAHSAIAMGSGTYHWDGFNFNWFVDSYLENAIPSSLLVGFGANPVLFVNGSAAGIRTLAPTQTLDVNGSANFSGINAQVWVNGSLVCTAANGLCDGTAPETDPLWSGNASLYYLKSNPLSYYNSSTLPATPYQSSAGGWTNTSTVTSTALGVGIGTATPTHMLHVQSNVDSTGVRVNGSAKKEILLTSTTDDAFISVERGGAVRVATINFKHMPGSGTIMSIGMLANSPNLAITSNIYGTPYVVINHTNGNLGIGTVTPAQKLDVNGTSAFKGNMTYAIPGGSGEVCFERFVGSTQNYTRCINSTGQVTERFGSFVIN